MTVTWIQLNSELLRLTREARFGEELERTFYNHLTAAQRPNGDWCYFTPLEGTKPYDPALSCCHSSGPRGVALIPQQAYFVFPGQGLLPDTLAVNLFEKSRGKAKLRGAVVEFEQQTAFPRNNEITLSLKNKQAARFAVAVRAPAWALPMRANVNTQDGAAAGPAMQEGWLVFPARVWQSEDRIRISLNLRGEMVAGTHGNEGRAALRYGPYILAYDEKENLSGQPAAEVALDAKPREPVLTLKGGMGLLEFQASLHAADKPAGNVATFVPFADAGLSGGRYQVWLPQAAPSDVQR